LSSRVAIALALGLVACSPPVVVVNVQNTQGLAIASEQVQLDLITPDGQHLTAQPTDFMISANLGTFSIQLDRASRGTLHIVANFTEANGALVGRASGTVTLDGRPRTDVQLRATRFLAGMAPGIVAGIPGGPGNRDGATGPDPSLPMRLDSPVGFTALGFESVNGDRGFVLQSCGAIRRIIGTATNSNVDTFLPCSRHTAPGLSGKVSDLSLDQPTAIVAVPGHAAANPTSQAVPPTLYIAEGARIFAIPFPGGQPTDLDVPATSLTYYDVTPSPAPMHISSLAVGPYNVGLPTELINLYVADDVANLVWVYTLPVDGSTPAVVNASPPIGAGSGSCSPLPAAEGAKSTVPPGQAHLCGPASLTTGLLALGGSDPVLFISDPGHGAVRMLAPNALGNGVPGVTTMFAGISGMGAIGYELLLKGALSFYNGDLGTLFFFHQNQMSFLITKSDPTMPLALEGVVTDLTTGTQPGYSATFNIISGLGTSAAAGILFDDVTQVYRTSTDRVVGRDSLLLIVERGSSAVQQVNSKLDVQPWFGAGRQLGNASAPSKPFQQAVFGSPAGMDWNRGAALFVADRDNQAIAQVGYDSSGVGLTVNALVGCPDRVMGPGLQAALGTPAQVAYDDQGSTLYVLDSDGMTLRRVQVQENNDTLTATGVDALFDSTVSTDCGSASATSTPGPLGTMSSFAFDSIARRVWVAHTSTPDLAFFDADNPSTPTSVALPTSFQSPQLAIIDRTLFVVDSSGHLAQIDLTQATPQAQPQMDLPLLGALVTAVGSDGEWLYVADDSARVWRYDPLAPPTASPATLFLGDGTHGLFLGQTPPGLNRVGGFGYDAERGILFLSDSVENSMIAIQ
jgi:hypothetical protein